jgi:hypothetical protein
MNGPSEAIDKERLGAAKQHGSRLFLSQMKVHFLNARDRRKSFSAKEQIMGEKTKTNRENVARFEGEYQYIVFHTAAGSCNISLVRF